ncbi:aldo/keto reductase [Amycolatopsis taiwanensis]|uniref:Oxidoreductase n=1 Tax=Amycolatopsis taiwanensis TaxID=342230 RepID=A0A9W6R547_9PSEU|nr:aldo/keto reductase [Amycolatopsis taiwanensis]GLY68818.1 oxidoreductase [Amycolatopsis taiwanensis]
MTTHTITLGGDLTVNRIGYGAMHLTGPGVWGWYPDPDHAVRVLRRAVDLGVTFIDTADSYGPATNEMIIAKALRPYPEDLVISTKGGMLRTGPDDWANHGGPPYIMPLGRPEYLRQQVELSLVRLGLDCIPLYQLHSIDPTVPLADQIGVLAELQRAGKIRHIGMSNQPGVTIDQLAEARRYAEIVSIENLFNIADRADEKTLRHVEQEGVAFIPWFPLGHGDLTGPGSPLAPIAADYGAGPSQLALAWLLHCSPATLLIPGTTDVEHLAENIGAADITLTSDDVAEITRRVEALDIRPWRPVD